MQRQLREGVFTTTPQRVPEATQQLTPSPTPEEERVLVQRFSIEGATLVPIADLTAAVQPFVGKTLGLEELRAAARTLADVYRRRGFFARAVLPPQDITAGTVRIQLIEGRFGQLVLDDQARRADGAFVARVAGARLKQGMPYSADALERGMLIANDLPGVSADGVLKAGAEHGTSDLALTVRDAPLLRGSVGGDNGGAVSTGRYRAIGTLTIDGLTGRGDRVSALALGSEGLGYGWLGWSVPIGFDGWRVEAHVSYLRYKLGGSFASLDGRGDAWTQGIDLTYPLVRSSSDSLDFRAAYEHGQYNDDLLGAPAHRKHIHRVSLSLGGESLDAAGGRSRYSIGMTVGGLDLSGLAFDQALDRVTARTDGAYAKAEASASHDQRVGAATFVRASVAGQWALNNLDSSEQFALGGPAGVRAYPVNEGLGDTGYIASLEVHQGAQFASTALDLYGFADIGMIRQRAKTWPGGALPGTKGSYTLGGAGVGVSYSLPRGFVLGAVVAVPIGSNPGGADSRHNQDGSRRNARGWLTLSKHF
ncbi:ShlB/FhaC/HecB family hemolysin secretion/activation protein [Altererythrobacter sp. B11]|uniref:ShlB/FhaC/HecB family hemolysin secretion/activation protein n=1 Tax=Altererythrobacter sp. B11 TaxID=2060312 RepID=UPI0015585AA9|nr:ShlB/FhaC/HecB family hemolysin secretion/activation protein [Altererythrobacter sp. B11]